MANRKNKAPDVVTPAELEAVVAQVDVLFHPVCALTHRMDRAPISAEITDAALMNALMQCAQLVRTLSELQEEIVNEKSRRDRGLAVEVHAIRGRS